MFLGLNLGYQNQEIANVLTGYEIATLVGTCILGPLTDLTYGKRSPIAMLAIALASFSAFYLTFMCEDLSRTGIAVVMCSLGFFLGSIYHIVNVTCCADLGKEQRGKTATATIAGIIDGCGSLGTGTGMFCLGFFIDKWGYQFGFVLIVAIMITMSMVPLTFILIKDIGEIRQLRRQG